jgi:RNA polymerase sigma factor (sigma-70 family)
MSRVPTPPVVQQIQSLFDGGSIAGLSDRELLERFNARRDAAGEAAFAALVARHGPMVLGVCRQLLGDQHLAEDVFQAVFLVLARKAGSIREPELLGNWLYGVALRTARKARVRLARRRRTEEEGCGRRPAEPLSATAEQALLDRERAEALHHEMDRLPGAFRVPVVLCYFEGLSPEEAARRLRWPSGTLRSRLARARDKLRRGLVRRGIMLSGPALAAASATRSASASVSPLLCDSTARAAIQFAARRAASGGLLASAATLAQEVLRTMLIHRLRTTFLSLLLLTAVATGAGWLARSPARGEGPMRDPAASAARVAPHDADRPRPEPKPDPATAGRMTVTGRVLDPSGQPAAGVPVDLIASSRTPTAATDEERDPFVSFVLLGQGAADSDGRFRIEAIRTSSTRFSDVYALAGASGPGSAFGCVKLPPDAEQPAAEIHLQPEQVIRGRLVDVHGQPAAGVEVGLTSVYSESSLLGAGRFDIPRPLLGSAWRAGLRAWPKAVTTDARGRFTFADVGRGLHVTLAVRDPRFARQQFRFEPKDRDPAKEVALALHPSTVIEGRVLAADTGQPIPGAVLAVWANFGSANPGWMTKFRADDQGRFKVNPYAGDYFRPYVFPPAGQPYLSREAEFAWTKGAVRKEVEFKLARGVLIRGKVTEQGTGRPVAGASVQFFPAKKSHDLVYGSDAILTTRDGGSFQVAGPPGKGYLMVVGPTLDYIPQEIGGGKPFGSGVYLAGGNRFHAHAIVAYEVKAGEGPRELNASSGRARRCATAWSARQGRRSRTP